MVVAFQLVFLVTGVFNPVMSTGLDAVAVNPAQLGYPERPGFFCRVVDLGFRVDNNSFNLAQYNRYTGAYLDSAAKDEIIGSIPPSGFGLRVSGDASAVEFGYSNMVVSVRTEGFGQFVIPGEAFELALLGNEPGRRYRAEDVGAGGLVFLRAGVAAAGGIGSNVAVGLGAHYLRGLAYAELRQAEAQFLTTPTAFSADGVIGYRRATGGSGCAFDLGVAFWKNDWRFTLACLDIGPGITWTEGGEDGIYTFCLDSGNAYEIRSEKLFHHDFDCHPVFGFVTRLPVVVNLGVSHEFLNRLSAAVLFQERFGVSRDWGAGWLAAGLVEARPWVWLPVGLDVSYGDPGGVTAGVGAGLTLGRLVLATRLGYVSGLLLNAKGVEFGLRISYVDSRRGKKLEPFLLHYDVE